MKQTCKITPVNGYDIPGLEGWLEKQAAGGLLFYMSVGPFTLFRQAEPAALRFHLEPAPDKPDRTDPELNDLYEQAGWRYLGLFRSSFAVFATENLESQAHTDPDIWSGVLRRFFRQKLLSVLGLAVLNFLFLSTYWRHLAFSWSDLRWFSMELLSHQPVIASVLTVIGLALVDLSWLLGLIALWRYRKAVTAGRTPPKHTHGGGMLAAGTLILLLVLAETFWPLAGLNHRIDPSSDFITLADIEGDSPNFQVNEQTSNFYDYGYWSGTLFLPERWSFWQSGRHPWVNGAPDPSVPRLSLQVYRYPMAFMAEKMTEEQSRIQWNGGSYEVLSPAQGLDQLFLSRDRFDPEDVLPCVRLLLRQGTTVLLVEYHGEQDLTQFLPRFAEIMEAL